MKHKICLVTFVLSTLVGTPWSLAQNAAEKKQVKVEIGTEGFQPSQISVKKGTDLTLLITRKSDRTCMTDLKKIGEKGTVALPLNKETAFHVGVLKKDGEIKILCGMDMTAGVIQVN